MGSLPGFFKEVRDANFEVAAVGCLSALHI
jgi:hypothetical protein